MSYSPSLDEQELLADTFRHSRATMTSRERLIDGTVGAGFAIAVACLWLIQPPHSFAVVPAGLCMLVLAVATCVRFDTPFGFTVPTQLGFVPLLFAMPAALVPLGVAAALAAARVPDVLTGRYPPSRLLRTIGNSWFAIGPAAVFVLADTDAQDAGAVLLLGALAAQFAVDFAISTVRFAIARGARLSAQLRELWVYAIDAALSPIALIVAEDIHATPAAALAPLPLLAVLASFAHERRQRLESLIELHNAYRGTALVLGDVIEADDGYTGVHCKGVVGLALAISDSLQLTSEQRRNLEFAALLHDVGKIAIPKEIINKPGKLDPHEWQIIKTHTVEGQKMLNRVGGFMRTVGLIVRSHHERWDGTGYPDGLAGEAIPLEARIIACCDAWNAMRTDRPYRTALPHDAALAELRANAHLQFDEHIVTTLLEILEPAAPNPNTHKTRQPHRLLRPTPANALDHPPDERGETAPKPGSPRAARQRRARARHV